MKRIQLTLEGNIANKWTSADVVYTPDYIAHTIVDMFHPEGKMLDPAKGGGAFLQYMPDADWCEISEGKDFFDYNDKVDWIITEPPFSIFTKFLIHAFEIADNVVFLIPLNKIFRNWATMREVIAYGGIKTMWIIHPALCGFDFRFPMGAIYFKRGYKGSMQMLYYDDKMENRKPPKIKIKRGMIRK